MKKILYYAISGDHPVLQVVDFTDEIETLVVTPLRFQSVKDGLQLEFLFFDFSISELFWLFEVNEASDCVVADYLIDNNSVLGDFYF